MIGLCYGALLAQALYPTWISVVIGMLNGVAIAGCLAGIEIFLLRGAVLKQLLRLPFVVVVAIKTVAYAGIVSVFVILLPRLASQLPLDAHTQMVTISASLATTLIFVIALQVAGLLGRRTFRNLMLGRYRNPRAERRFFLFVDVVGSTAIAERLGPLQAHRFLAAVFSATAEPIAACRGEIYQYIGDEIVVTWTEEDGRPEARPLRCFFLMEESLRELKDMFRAQFAAEPGLRAALHLGEVIAGEVGEQRRAIVYHGDVMNTASRLEQATRDARLPLHRLRGRGGSARFDGGFPAEGPRRPQPARPQGTDPRLGGGTGVTGYSITLPARARIDSGSVIPSAAAVFLLTAQDELRRLLDRQLAGVRALQDPVHVVGRALVAVVLVVGVAEQAALLDAAHRREHRRQLVLERKRGDRAAARVQVAAVADQHRLHGPHRQPGETFGQVAFPAHVDVEQVAPLLLRRRLQPGKHLQEERVVGMHEQAELRCRGHRLGQQVEALA